MSWQIASRQNGEPGVFVILVKRGTSAVTGISPFRGIMPVIEQFTYADPFEDATAIVRFPQVTAFEAMGQGDLWWLEEFTNLDIYWLPATGANDWANPGGLCMNPMTGARDWYIHHTDPNGYNWLPMWEGYIASIEPDAEGVRVTCQGVFYQLDRYYTKPFFPVKPWPFERLIQREFSKSTSMRTDPRKGLLAKALLDDHILWPANWARQATTKDVNPPEDVRKIDRLTVGQNFTGYSTRNTGSFEQSLTGYIQSLLAMMVVGDEHLPANDPMIGSQWTLMKAQNERRRPVLTVRDKNRAPDFSVWYGQPGVEASLTRDGLSTVNIVYAQGTGFDGAAWQTTEQVGLNGKIKWIPLEYVDGVWPYTWSENDEANWPNERYENFPTGVTQVQASQVAKQWLKRDSTPGWTGTIVLTADPVATGNTPGITYSTNWDFPLVYSAGQPFLKWRIRAGMTILLKGFAGTGASGMRFHVAEVTCDPEANTVTLRVDTKYRDLLSVEQVMAQTRDPLTPVKALRVNQASALIQDLLVPWDYSKGCGMIPQTLVRMYDDMGNKATPPWTSYLTQTGNRPRDQFQAAYVGSGSGHGPIGGAGASGIGVTNEDYLSTCVQNGVKPWYIPVNAGNSSSKRRWSFMPIQMAQAGDISKIEVYAYDKDGNLLPIPFHVSLYYWKIGVGDMPAPQVGSNKGDPTPFFEGAFESVNLATGQPYVEPDYHKPPPGMIIGWGNLAQPCGYSPGAKTEGNALTGRFVDAGEWSFSFMSDEYGISPGVQEVDEVDYTQTTAWIALYAELVGTPYEGNANYNWVYLAGRMYKKNQGSTGG